MSSNKETKARSKNAEDGAGPAKKKAKQEANNSSSSPAASKQSNLLQFFGNKSSTAKSTRGKASAATKNAIKSKESASVEKETFKGSNEKISKEKKPDTNDATTSLKNNDAKTSSNNTTNKANAAAVPDPIIPHSVPPDTKAQWRVMENCMLVRSIKKEEPRTKAAAFDVDGTLLVWRISGWPSKFEHYELWNDTLIDKLRELHDNQGYKLILFSNQGAIRGAFTGKKATFVKSLLEWLARTIDRPVQMVMSTNKKMGYHKPNPGMWEICEKYCNKGVPLSVEESFFVGDSVGDEDPQGGVDDKFAENVGTLKGGTLKFYTPEQYFGPSDSDKRKKQGDMADFDAPPSKALDARRALLGGYLQGPIVLLLSGVQGSGKSTFSKQVLTRQDQYGDLSNNSDSEENESSGEDSAWVHLSQDTINKGKPGKREAVEEATRQAIRKGCSVIVDRMHLEPEQRKYFVDVAKELNAPVHIVVFQPSKDVITKRVRERTNHPGGVEGDKGVRVALMSMSKLTMPNYKDEGFNLITCVQREKDTEQLSGQYRQVLHKEKPVSAKIPLQRRAALSCGISMPCLALGTMSVGKRVAEEVVTSALDGGWRAVDTAPTYKNEDVVGKGLAANAKTFVIVKIPKRATQPEEVREELDASLKKLGIKKAGLLLLHWPCDVIDAGTLKVVWEAMEKCVADGKCRALGVCNFSVNALRQLLPHCTIPPAVNQVERHPLLPQMGLLDFCINQGIVVQAHTTLGQGKLISHEMIVEVAKKANLTPAQVLVQWNLRHGVASVCKCASIVHQEELLEPFHLDESPLSAAHMKALDQIKENKRFVSPPFMMAPGTAYSWRS